MDEVRVEDVLRHDVVHLVGADVADTHLHYACGAVLCAAHHAGVVVGRVVVAVAEVRVSVNLQHREVGIGLRHRLDRTHGDGVLPAQEDRTLAHIHEVAHPVVDGFHHRFRRAQVVIVAVGMDAGQPGLVLVLDVIQFQTVGCVQDGLRAFVGTLHEGARTVVRHAHDHISGVVQLVQTLIVHIEKVGHGLYHFGLGVNG